MSDAAPKKKSPLKLVVLLLGGLLLAAGSAGGAYWFAGKQAPASADAEPVKKPPSKPVFANLDVFTVNLQDTRGERFAQIGITLEIDTPSTEVEIKDRLPAVRNNVLLLLSSKRVDDLLSNEGKQLLAQEVRVQVGKALGVEPPAPGASALVRGARENPVRGVLFSQFIVQ